MTRWNAEIQEGLRDANGRWIAAPELRCRFGPKLNNMMPDSTALRDLCGIPIKPVPLILSSGPSSNLTNPVGSDKKGVKGKMAASASKVFISYNHADRDWTEWIAGVIKEAGYEPILDVWHFRPGENFVLRMQEPPRRRT